MSRSTAELMRLMMAHRAAADALEGTIKARALDAHEAGELAAGQLPGLGRVETRFTKDGVQIVDEATLLLWLRARFPDEVVIVFRPRNPEWVKHFLSTMEPMDAEDLEPGQGTQVMHGGEPVPGVVWTRGGKLATIAIVRDPSTQSRLGRAAKLYAEGKGVIPGLPSGEGES